MFLYLLDKIICELEIIKKHDGTTRGIANKGLSGMQSASPASIFCLG